MAKGDRVAPDATAGGASLGDLLKAKGLNVSAVPPATPVAAEPAPPADGIDLSACGKVVLRPREEPTDSVTTATHAPVRVPAGPQVLPELQVEQLVSVVQAFTSVVGEEDSSAGVRIHARTPHVLSLTSQACNQTSPVPAEYHASP